MPWNITDPMSERLKFVLAVEENLFNMTELCLRFGISRKTGYKWLRRYRRFGAGALEERSRARRTMAHRTPSTVEQALVELRKAHPYWGARKLLVVLHRRRPELTLPAASTVTDILHRHGCIVPKRKRRARTYPGSRPLAAEAPNHLWTADFKGEFLLGNHHYCYPLTICDAHSRFILGCQALEATAHKATQSVFTRLFRTYGLPQAIRTDNGTPFASIGLRGLSRLGAYFIRLGIKHERIDPGSPQQNGRHERMHRTLKAETTRPPENTMKAQQRRFNDFVKEFNTVRPHEAIEMAVPAKRYRRSKRPMPRRLARPNYAGHMELRRVGKNGGIRFRTQKIFLTTVLERQYVALEEIDDAIWNIFYYDVLLARYDERNRHLYP